MYTNKSKFINVFHIRIVIMTNKVTNKVDSSYFETLRKEIEDYDSKREKLIRDSRDLVSLSKKIIYSVHRGEYKKAETEVKNIKKILSKVSKEVEKTSNLDIGAYKVGVQEYVEAVCYLEFMKKDKLSTHKDLGVSVDNYLLGVCDLVGELGRNSRDSGIKEDYDTVKRIREFVNDLYSELMQFNFRNGELRKKVDGIRHELQKIDNLVFSLKMKGE
jgi:translin